MRRRHRVLAGIDPTFVVEDRARPGTHETKYTVDAVGNELLLYRDTATRRQLRRDRAAALRSRAVSALPRRWGSALARSVASAQWLGRPLRGAVPVVAAAAPSLATTDAGEFAPHRRVAEYDHTTEESLRREHVVSLLLRAGVRAAVAPAAAGRPTVVVIGQGDRARAVTALAAGLDGTWRALPLGGGRSRTVSRTHLRLLARRDGFRLFRHLPGPAGPLVGADVGVDVEIWPVVQPTRLGPGTLPAETDGTLVAPRRQAWTTSISAADWQDSVTRGVLAGGGRSHLLDVTGPIDVVYTWVNGEDPEWDAQRLAALGVPEDQRTAATDAARFRSHDELRYSLRSLEMFAPWVRHIHIVTAGQAPAWLDTDHPRVRLVDHRDIFTDPGVLPVFNSHAIESQLHHIPDLAERYLYLNDDVFFGRPVGPDLFFHGNGLAKFFMSSALMDARGHQPDDSPVASAAKNNRALIDEVFGLRVTNLFQHTPQPQLRSVLEHMEQAHPEQFARVAASPFRHPEDLSISSALHHYYAYGLGKAVPGRLASLYLDLAHPRAAARLRTLLRRREFDVFCINDSPGAGAERRARLLQEFFERYFPLPSSFELPLHDRSPEPSVVPVARSASA